MVQQYLLTVLAAAILCAIIFKLTEKGSNTFSVIKLTASLFLTITVLSPVLKIDFDEISGWINRYDAGAGMLITDGTGLALEKKISLIKERTEAYVLKKAAECGANVEVEVIIDDLETLLPNRILLTGTASPYAKQLLQETISEDLGIPKERQLWN